MPNRGKPVSAAARRARKREGEHRLQNRLDEATEACGATSRICRQLENENRILSDAARSPRGIRECQHQACSLLVDPNFIPSTLETIQLSISTCSPAQEAGDAHRHSANPAPDAALGFSDESSHFSPRSGSDSGGSPSVSPSLVLAPPSPLPPSCFTRDQRAHPQASWPGSPFSSPGD